MLLATILFFQTILPIIITVAFFTLAERKLMASVQRRQGPTIVGLFGLLQPLSDGLKLVLKEIVIPSKTNSIIFILAPFFAFFFSLLGWIVLPVGTDLVILDLDLGLLFLLAIWSLNSFTIIFAGWASNSKFALLSALRSSAQMLSYELALGFIVLSLGLCTGTLNLIEIVYFQKKNLLITPLLPLFFLFFLITLVETNRAPFDLAESESELVAGFNVEYSSITFALFFLAEYSNIILMCGLTSIIFFGGWVKFLFLGLGLKTVVGCFCFIFIRSTLPRQRFDQLLNLGWKVFLVFTLAFFIVAVSVLYFFLALPLPELVVV